MGLSTATIEMQSPEEHRERLHELVKAARTVLVLRCDRDDRIAGQPMALLRTGDDTTLYVAASLDAPARAALVRPARVMVVVPDGSCATFDAEAVISRDPMLDPTGGPTPRLASLDGTEGRKAGRSHPSAVVLVISPIEGTYWHDGRRHAYLYRVAPARGARELSDGVPVEI